MVEKGTLFYLSHVCWGRNTKKSFRKVSANGSPTLVKPVTFNFNPIQIISVIIQK
jgi:hypothetical protein